MIEKLFLSVGAMKAGTTWLYDKLKQHPDIHFSPQKEVHFLSHHYGHTNILALSKREKRACVAMRRLRAKEKDPKRVRLMRRWYADYKAEPLDYPWFETIMEADRAAGRYLADFSNLNCFLTPDDWNDLKRNHVKHLRVLYIMRDPVERAWSHFKFHLQFSKHPAAKQPDKDFRLFRQILEKHWFWRNACYADTVKSLRAGLETEQLKITYFEDMVSAPEQFLRSLETFLGLAAGQYRSDLRKPRNPSIGTALPQQWRHHLCELLEQQNRQLAVSGVGHPIWTGQCKSH
jgi:hypothetical protein